MKITHSDEQMLIVEERGWALGVILILSALFFLWFGGVAMWPEEPFAAGLSVFFGAGTVLFSFFILVNRARLLLNATDGTAELRIKTMKTDTTLPLDLADISHLEIELIKSTKNRTLVRMVLVVRGGMDAGKHPLGPNYGEVRPTQRLVSDINAWITAHGKPPA